MGTITYNIHIDHTIDESGSKQIIIIRPTCIQKNVFIRSVRADHLIYGK